MSGDPLLLSGYNTHRAADREAMLAAIGADGIEALFKAIPRSLRLKRPLNLPDPLPEWELFRRMETLAGKNATTKTHNSFLGGGAYTHYIPAVVDAIVSRGEFLTSYTPYQPEISQGLLQALFEYQTALAMVTGLPVVNGSCYDGATALSDAAWCACLISKQANGSVVVSEGIWPHWQRVVETYMKGRSVPIEALSLDKKTGQTDIKTLDAFLAKQKPAGFLFQAPNCAGIFEDVAAIAETCAKHDVVSVCAFNPLAAGIVTPPGLLGVDIVVCDGQPLGIPLSAGGPSLGVFATRREYRKYVPGRLIGKVTDINGNLAYALVYEDREQHVARERATSNICSNQALNALRAVVYLASLGENGLAKIAALNARKSHYLAGKLEAEGIRRVFDGTFFNEFVVALPKPVAPVLKALQAQNIFGGVDYSGKLGLKHALLISVTETKTHGEMDAFTAALKKAIA